MLSNDLPYQYHQSYLNATISNPFGYFFKPHSAKELKNYRENNIKKFRQNNAVKDSQEKPERSIGTSKCQD